MNSRPEISYSMFNTAYLSALSEQDRLLLTAFINSSDQDKKIISANQIYIFPYNNQNYALMFDKNLIIKNPKKIYMCDRILGEGGFGRVYEGLGTLRMQEDRYTIKQSMHCDLIYISPACRGSLSDLIQTVKSKTAFVMIHDELFYIDKTTYRPQSSIKYVGKLDENLLQSILAKYQLNETGEEIQFKPRLTENELHDFENYLTQQTNKNYVIKMQEHYHYDEGHLPEKAIEEAKICERATHSGVVRAPFFNNDQTFSFTKIEKKPGISLEDIIEHDLKYHSLTYENRILLTHALFKAIIQLHKDGIIHRDLKPDNILVEIVPGGMTVSIVDFGLSTLKDEPGNNPELEPGTLSYCPPEHLKKKPSSDSRSDGYSFAITLAKLWNLAVTRASLDTLSHDRFINDILMNDTKFTSVHEIEDKNNLRVSLMQILEGLSKRNPDNRLDLVTALQQFESFEVVRDHLHVSNPITDAKTKEKLLSMLNNSQLSSREEINALKVIPDLSKNSISQHEINTHDSMLTIAIRDNNQKLFADLIKTGIDVDQPTSDGHTPLYLAITYNRPQMVRELLHSKVDLNAVIEVDREKLYQFAEEGAKQTGLNSLHKLDALFYISKKNDNKIELNMLQLAACLGRKKIVELLLDQGADPSHGELTSFDYAISTENDKIFALLLPHDPEAIDDLLKAKVLLNIMIKILYYECGTENGRLCIKEARPRFSEKAEAIYSAIENELSGNEDDSDTDILKEIYEILTRPPTANFKLFPKGVEMNPALYDEIYKELASVISINKNEKTGVVLKT